MIPNFDQSAWEDAEEERLEERCRRRLQRLKAEHFHPSDPEHPQADEAASEQEEE